MKRLSIGKHLTYIGLALGLSAPWALSAQTYHYYDGDRKVTVTQEAGLLAEKAGLGAGGVSNPNASLVKRADSSADVVQNVGGLRIWKANANSVKNNLSKNASGKRYSDEKLIPVFRSESGALMVPTGNMIVYFRLDMTDKEVSAWAAKRGLRPLQKLPLSTKNAWEIQTPPGIASLEIAEEVRSDGDVDQATPNWWMEFSKK